MKQQTLAAAADRAGLEAVLGFPKYWPGFQLTYRRRGRLHAITRFEITVDNSARAGSRVTRIELDGSETPCLGRCAIAR